MSLTSKVAYLAEKVRLIKERIAPIITWYNDMKQLGLDKIAELAAEIQNILAIIHEYDSKINDLINVDILSPTSILLQVKDILNYTSTKLNDKDRDKLLDACRRLDRQVKKLESLKLQLIEYRVNAVEKVEKMIESSLTGVSGFDVNIEITLPDPITGEGGMIIPIITPKLIDETTLLLDSTLTDPTTIVNSVVTVTGTVVVNGTPVPVMPVPGTTGGIAIAQGIITT